LSIFKQFWKIFDPQFATKKVADYACLVSLVAIISSNFRLRANARRCSVLWRSSLAAIALQ
jgi:hypothetical protein